MKTVRQTWRRAVLIVPAGCMAGIVMLGVACGGDDTTQESATTAVEQSDPATDTSGSTPVGDAVGCAAVDLETVERIFGYQFEDASAPDDREDWESCGYAAVGSAAVAVQRLETNGRLMWDQAVASVPDALPVDVGDEAIATVRFDEIVQGNAVQIFAREGDVFVQVVVTILGTAAGSEPDPAVLAGAVEVAELAL